jgi:tRNA(Ile)-lysidine synthase
MDGASAPQEIVRRCLRSLEGIEAGTVIAVSGGCDSVALLRLVLAVRDPVVPVTVAHLNHQLRGAESDADEEFVIGLHTTLSQVVPMLSIRTARLDVKALARAEGDNLEAVARSARYRWLAEVARDAGARWVATGHTANDQAETVLHRLLRGTGLQGLRGIAQRRRLTEAVSVIRPLLHVARAELAAYLHGLDQCYRQDTSNSDLRFTRNRIRHELLPHLERHYNPAVVSVLCRLAEQADVAHRVEEAEATVLLREAELPRAGTMLVFDAQRLAEAPRRMVRVLFRMVWAREGWPTARMDFAAWQRMAGLVFSGAGGGDFPGGIRARRRERVIQVTPDPGGSFRG